MSHLGRSFGLVLSVGLLASASRAEHTLEVAGDGSGDFTTVQEAIDEVPDGLSDWTVIHIAAGYYFERLEIPVSKRKVILVGDGPDATILEYDESVWNEKVGGLVAVPVLINRAREVVIRSLAIRNLADEPGGSGGKWDAAIENFGDRLILNDVFLRADQDTLLLYGVAHMGGPGPSRVYVRDSHIQGRGDFIASFTSTFIERSVLETIRDRGHFLFQKGIPDRAPADQDALVVKDSVFTGRSLDPTMPAGATNLMDNAFVYLVGNVFEYDVGANRPVAHFHDGTQPLSSQVMHFGNTQNLSPRGPLIWDLYSIPGPTGTPHLDLPVQENAYGDPIVDVLTPSEAAALTPAWLFGNWDPVTEEPRADCEDGIDNDGDQAIDLFDPGCASIADFSELSHAYLCDDGIDNDGDGWIDFAGGDPGCRDPSSLWEAPACQDGVNNDGKLGTDFDAGVSVRGAAGADPDGADPNCLNAPWVGSERPPASCGLGPGLIPALWLLARMQRNRRV